MEEKVKVKKMPIDINPNLPGINQTLEMPSSPGVPPGKPDDAAASAFQNLLKDAKPEGSPASQSNTGSEQGHAWVSNPFAKSPAGPSTSGVPNNAGASVSKDAAPHENSGSAPSAATSSPTAAGTGSATSAATPSSATGGNAVAGVPNNSGAPASKEAAPTSSGSAPSTATNSPTTAGAGAATSATPSSATGGNAVAGVPNNSGAPATKEAAPTSSGSAPSTATNSPTTAGAGAAISATPSSATGGNTVASKNSGGDSVSPQSQSTITGAPNNSGAPASKEAAPTSSGSAPSTATNSPTTAGAGAATSATPSSATVGNTVASKEGGATRISDSSSELTGEQLSQLAQGQAVPQGVNNVVPTAAAEVSDTPAIDGEKVQALVDAVVKELAVRDLSSIKLTGELSIPLDPSILPDTALKVRFEGETMVVSIDSKSKDVNGFCRDNLDSLQNALASSVPEGAQVRVEIRADQAVQQQNQTANQGTASDQSNPGKQSEGRQQAEDERRRQYQASDPQA